MSMERRDQQSLNLLTCTSPVLRDRIIRHNGSGRQQSLWPNRWERIGSRALDKDAVFNNLLTHINVETLTEAFHALDGKRAEGIDGIAKAEYGRNLEKNLEGLVNRIHRGTYRPQARRVTLIPKSDGRKRPIAIACFEDKLVEWVIAQLLTIIYEPLFIRNSFGFRPNKSAHEALKAVYMTLKNNRRPYVVEIDFSNFFDTIPHKGLMKALSRRTSDKRFKGLIGRFLKGGLLDQSGEATTPTVGTPQGGVMSPVLANIYLNEALDQWFIEKYASYSNIIIRYADDAVFFFKNQETAKQFLEELQERVKRFGLTLNMDKTHTVDFHNTQNTDFDFLGFTIYWGSKKKFRRRPLKFKTRKKSLHKKMQEFEQWIKAERSAMKLSELWKRAGEKLKGHYSYFGLWTNYPKLWHFYSEAIRSLFKWLNRRSQKRSYDWEAFKRRLENLPLPEPPTTQKLKCFDRGYGYV